MELNFHFLLCVNSFFTFERKMFVISNVRIPMPNVVDFPAIRMFYSPISVWFHVILFGLFASSVRDIP